MSLVNHLAPFLQNLQQKYSPSLLFHHEIILSFVSTKSKTAIELDLELVQDEIRFSGAFCLIGIGVGVSTYLVYRLARWALPSCHHVWSLCCLDGFSDYQQYPNEKCSCCGQLVTPLGTRKSAVPPTDLPIRRSFDRETRRSQDHGFFSSYPTLSDLCIARIDPATTDSSVGSLPGLEQYLKARMESDMLASKTNSLAFDWLENRFHSTPDFLATTSCDDKIMMKMMMESDDAVFNMANTPDCKVFENAGKLELSTISDIDLLERQLSSVTNEVDALTSCIESLRSKKVDSDLDLMSKMSRDSLDVNDDLHSKSCYIPRVHLRPTNSNRLGESLDVLWDNEDGLFASRLTIFNDSTPNVSDSTPNISHRSFSRDLFSASNSPALSSPEREVIREGDHRLPSRHAVAETKGGCDVINSSNKSKQTADRSAMNRDRNKNVISSIIVGKDRSNIFDYIEASLSADLRNEALAYYELARYWHVAAVRTVKTDGCSVLRATLLQALLNNALQISIKDMLQKFLNNLIRPDKNMNQLFDWNFGSKFSSQTPVALAYQNIDFLLNTITRFFELRDKIERERYLCELLNSDPNADANLIQAVKLLMFFNLTSLYRNYLSRQNGFRTPPFLLPLFNCEADGRFGDGFFVNYLNETGEARLFNSTDIFVLALSLQVKIEIIRPTCYPHPSFIAHYPDEGVDGLSRVAILEQSENRYALLL